MPNITPLPTPPSRSDPPNFNARADAFLAHLQTTFTPEVNALRTEVLGAQTAANTSAANAATSASTAQAASTAAQSFANAAMWNATTNYAVGALAVSAVNWQVYRRKVAGTTATNPASDTTNWALAAGNHDITGSAARANGSLQSVRLYQAAGTYSWTKPANLARIRLTVAGGGGGPTTGRGGGQGCSVVVFAESASVPASVSVTVGAGGAPSGPSGYPGGASSFGTLVTAAGGAGGDVRASVGGQGGSFTSIMAALKPLALVRPGARGAPWASGEGAMGGSLGGWGGRYEDQPFSSWTFAGEPGFVMVEEFF